MKLFSIFIAVLFSSTLFADVWSEFRDAPRSLDQSPMPTIEFVKSYIAPKFRSYANHGGFAKQLPPQPKRLEKTSTVATVGEFINFYEKKVIAPKLRDVPQNTLTDMPEISLAGIFDQPANEVVDASTVPEPRNAHVSITPDEAGNLQFNPKLVVLKTDKESVTYSLSDPGEKKLLVYPGNDHMVKIDTENQEITAIKKGETEVFFLWNDKVSVLPITIGLESELDGITVPQSLVEIGTTKLPAVATIKDESSHYVAKTSQSYSIHNVGKEQEMVTIEPRNFTVAQVAQSYQSVRVQLVDERSNGYEEKLFPVSRTKINIVGTEFIAETDARGIVEFRDIPSNSQLMLRVFDDEGLIQPSMIELQSNFTGPKMVMRKVSFEILQDMAQVAQSTNKGSLCGNTLDSELASIEGVSVEIDSPADGPFYFNRFGMIDQRLSKTGENGRFCFFNIDAGPTAIHIDSDSQTLETYAVPVFRGLHSERSFPVYDSSNYSATIEPSISASAHSHVRRENSPIENLQPLDWASVTPIGYDTEFNPVEDGVLTASSNLVNYNGFHYLLSQASDFEEMLIQLPVGTDPSVITLLPRGYVEDMAFHAQVNANPILGTLVVDHQRFVDSDGQVEFHLVDDKNNSIGQPWTYSSGQQIKTMFFNLEPGYYHLTVKSGDGIWLEARNTFVYSSTVSYMSTGAPIKKQP